MFRYLRNLKEEKNKYEDDLPVPWLQAAFQQLGLEVYTHNFTLHHPLGRDAKYFGQNVYAILRAQRASSTEALVFSVPYRGANSPEAGTDTSLAILLASAKFFRRQYYWAKDIIFLVTEHEQLGMQAWLEAYHQRSCGSGILDYGILEARAGSIQAAINFEMSDPKITHLNVKAEGLNGQLPNLDLIKLVNKLCAKERVGQLFQGREDTGALETWTGVQKSLETMLQMAGKQASGIPSGNHGLFHRFGIEAITVEGVTRGRRQASADLRVVGRVMEGIFRSLNSLLERLHQSFFFYLLPSSSRYVSIGMYMPGFGLLGGALVVAALGLWCQAIHEEKQDIVKKNNALPSIPVVLPSSLITLLPIFSLAHMLGAATWYMPQTLSKVGGNFFGMEDDDSVLCGIMILCTFGLFLPMLSPSSLLHEYSLTGGAGPVLKCLVLLELATLAFCVSLCNFGLAALVSTFFIPFALLSSASRNIVSNILKMCCGLLTHPLMLLFIACSVDSYHYTDGNFNLSDFADATKRALFFSVIDAQIYGSISYAMATLFLLPCWNLLWCLNFMKSEEETGRSEERKRKME